MILKSNFKYLCAVLLLGVMSGCATTDTKNMTGVESVCVANQEQKTEARELPPEAYKNVDDLLTVDCLLPGQLIQLGMYQQWMSPPRPARITAWECKVQGGQYALTSDKDGRETALKVWEGCADQGDKVAQNYMGEIYGRSWGEIRPDYERAAEWYRKSAEQGYSRALNNLGFLYENGLGIPQNKQSALDLYRQAMGEIKPIKLDLYTKNKINEVESKLNQALQTTKNLEKQLSESREIIQRKQNEINHLKQQSGSTATDQQVQVKKLQDELTQSRLRENTVQQQLSDAQQKLTTFQNQLTRTETQAAFGKALDVGKYYALIIGINDYRSPLDDLKTPVKDARRVEDVLKRKYGFETILLTDDGLVQPTRNEIFSALFKLKTKIGSNDNLLIYFAGHGEFYARSGYWLAQDADAEIRANWLSTDDITTEIGFQKSGRGGLKARHVLVVADSCYGAAMAMSWLEPSQEQIIVSLPQGLATRSAHSIYTVSSQIEPVLPPRQPGGESAESRIGIIKQLYELPSRIQLTSGGLQPVIDQEFRNGLSVFADAFTEALEVNEGIMSAEDIYREIKQPVFDRVRQVSAMEMKQAPVYRRIPNAGDNNGEFFFVPRKN